MAVHEADAVSIQPVPREQVIYASIVAFLAWMLSVYDFILFGTLLPLIAKDFGWSTDFSTFVATWVSVGTFLVAFTVGPMTDYLGRRGALVLTTAGAAVSSGLAALTFNPLYLIVVRALSGFGYSEQAVNTTYLSELYGPNRRGFLYSFVQGGWPIGVLFASAVTAGLLPLIGWRGVFAVATFPIIVIALLATRLPESPRFLAAQQVRRLLRMDRTEEARAFGATHGVDTEKAKRFSYLQLFQSDERKHTIWLGLSFLLNWIGIQIFVVLSTTVLVQGKGITMENALLFLVASNALSYVGYVVHGYVGDIIGRRETIAIGWVLAGICYGIMLLFAQGGAAVLIFYMLGLFFIIGPYSALFAYMGESYPTRSRGTGTAFINAMGPIGAIIGGAILTALLHSGLSVTAAAAIGGALPVLASGFTLLGARRIPPGQTLEQVAT
jgi:MFS family permease